MSGLVTQIQRFAINDGPGIRTTVFLKGCPLDCKWCHNPECISSHPVIFFRVMKCQRCGLCAEVCPEKIICLDQTPRKRIDRKLCTLCMKCVEVCPYGALTQVGEILTEETILDEVENDILFYRNSGGGITLSGGEPLFQVEFALNLLRGAKQRQVSTALDTCGYQSFDNIEGLLDYVNLVLYDIKHMDSARHKEGTGKGNELILENCEKLVDIGIQMRVRVPVIVGFNDSDENMEATSEFVRSLGLQNVDLLSYHTYAESKYEMLGKEYGLDGTEPLTDRRMSSIKEKFEHKGLSATIGG